VGKASFLISINKKTTYGNSSLIRQCGKGKCAANRYCWQGLNNHCLKGFVSQSVWEHCGWFKRLLSGKSLAISKQSLNLQSNCFFLLLQMVWSN